MRRALAAMSLTLATACADVPAPRPLDGVEFVCDEVLERGGGPACEFVRDQPAELRVWVPGERPEVKMDGIVRPPTAAHAVEAGWRLDIEVPNGSAEVVIQRMDSVLARWRLPLVWRDDALEPSALARAYQQGDWRSCVRFAPAEFTDAMAVGRSLRALIVARTGVLCSAQLGDTDAVQAWFADAEQVSTGPGIRDHLRDQLELDVLSHQGALHSVAYTFERAVDRSIRLGMTSSHAELSSKQALVLAELGDFEGASAAARASIDGPAHPYVAHCDVAAMRVNLAWVLLQGAERTGTSWHEAEDELVAAVGMMEDEVNGCSNEALAMTHLNLARLSLLRGAPQAASLWLDEAAMVPADTASPELLGELYMLRARAGLAAGDLADARDAADQATSLRDLPSDLELDILTTRAALSEADGRVFDAKELHEHAHRMTLARLGGLGHDQGAQRFVFDRLHVARGLVQLLHGLGDADGAFKVAREAASAEWRLLARRSALVRTSAASEAGRRTYLELRTEAERVLIERWDLPVAERASLAATSKRNAALHEAGVLGDAIAVDLATLPLRAPEVGEVLLLYLHIADDQFLGFAATVSGVVTANIDLAVLSPPSSATNAAKLATWSERLLGPFTETIAAAERVRVLPSFGMQAVPFHALPWNDGPLLAHTAVEYSLDLPLIQAPHGVQPRSALVIGDPLGDLEGARQEAEQVTDALHTRGMVTQRLVGRAAEGLAVRAWLPQVDHLHYAGHSESAGRFGWRGLLRLSQDTTLTIADIIALDRVPGTISLLSCDGGVVNGDPRGQTTALAMAFLFSGSHAVLASSIRLPATEAPAIAAALYGSPEGVMGIDLRSAYRTALLGPLARTVAPSTWQSLRLWVP